MKTKEFIITFLIALFMRLLVGIIGSLFLKWFDFELQIPSTMACWAFASVVLLWAKVGYMHAPDTATLALPENRAILVDSRVEYVTTEEE
jgi:hypothetical protein